MKKSYLALLIVPIILGACSKPASTSKGENKKMEQANVVQDTDKKVNHAEVSWKAEKGSKITYSINGDKFNDTYYDKYGFPHKIKLDKNNKYCFEINNGTEKEKIKIKQTKNGKNETIEEDLKSGKPLRNYSKISKDYKESAAFVKDSLAESGLKNVDSSIEWPNEADDFYKNNNCNRFVVETDNGKVVSISDSFLVKADKDVDMDEVTTKAENFTTSLMTALKGAGMQQEDITKAVTPFVKKSVQGKAFTIDNTNNGINLKMSMKGSGDRLKMAYKITREQ